MCFQFLSSRKKKPEEKQNEEYHSEPELRSRVEALENKKDEDDSKKIKVELTKEKEIEKDPKLLETVKAVRFGSSELEEENKRKMQRKFRNRIPMDLNIADKINKMIKRY